MAPRSGGWSPRNIRPGGCIILLLVLGLIGWGLSKVAHFSLPHLSLPIGNGPATSGGGISAQEAQRGDILFSTTGTKEAWARQEIARFNQQNAGQGQVSLALAESRDEMQAILNNKAQPEVWSPSSPVWSDRLGVVWASQHGGQQIVNADDPDQYRVFFKSPLVFVTTRQNAARLRPILQGASPWASVRAMALAGNIHFSYADPLNASSGMLTMSLIITEYAREHGSGDLDAVAASPGFATFLKQLDAGLVRADTQGSSALEKAYQADPGGRDFITAYESAGLLAVKAHPNLVMIYPSPTANADQGAAVLAAPWANPAQETTAQAFLKFIASGQAQQDGIPYGFRPAASNGADMLAQGLSDAQRAQFQASYTTTELPPYNALNEAAAQWHTQGP